MMKKIMTIGIISLFLIMLLTTVVSAETLDISEITKPGTVPTEVKDSVTKVWNNLSGAITAIGVGIASIMLIVVAIKYMSAAPNDKAELKKHLVIYVVGAIFIFCCVGVVNLLKMLAEAIF